MVADASAVTALCLSARGFKLVGLELQAPVLLRSEVLAAIRGMQWRGEITSQLAAVAVDRLLSAPISLVQRADVLREAYSIANALGWAKTYDAEYVALARLASSPLLTLDLRLARRVGDLVRIVTPQDL